MISFFQFFTEPLLRGPLLASLCISSVTGLLGVSLFVQKRSLLAETLSHAAYPGVILGVIVAFFCGFSSFFVLVLGMAAALAGMGMISFFTKRFFLSTDAAFTFILATFFALGVLLFSFVQSSYPSLVPLIKSYVYGQTATLTDHETTLYGCFACALFLFILLFYKELHLLFFDTTQALLVLGKKGSVLAFIWGALLTLCLVLAMQSVGVILISGLLIAPSLAARQYSNQLSTLFILSALFGAASSLGGNLASYYLSYYSGLSLPTGPMIVMMAQLLAFTSLLFSPNNGLFMRYLRLFCFQWKCREENLLKALWHQKGQKHSFTTLYMAGGRGRLSLLGLLLSCRCRGWLAGYQLTAEGERRGSHIVRLHRLWELYLVQDLGMQKEQVHRSAEEMEHILTPELASRLTTHLSDPLFDPHDQPIPRQGEVCRG